MSEVYKLWFNVGPVQGFVGQARRTRDLWTASWMLSNLTETALAKAEKFGGKAVNPYRSEGVVGLVESNSNDFGGYPNWFVVEFDSEEQAAFAATEAVKAFNDAWKQMADLVWNQKVKAFEEFGYNTKEIWERQISHFWEISWSVFSSENPPDRKTIRNVYSDVEPGTKCSLMGTYQEISGFYGKGSWKKQQLFWEELSKGSSYNLKGGEKLCATAVVKRFYPELSKLGKSAWPSTSFIAALPWLKVLIDEVPERAKQYFELAKSCSVEQSEVISAKELKLPSWVSLDAPYWYKNTLRNNVEELKNSKNLFDELEDLYKDEKLKNRKPVPYYALLVMDGDSMGDLIKSLQANGKSSSMLSKHLYEFSKEVPSIIKDFDGFTVYAGGDDVLAIIPAVNAIPAAAKVAEVYKKEFTQSGLTATISGAIVYAHFGYMLKNIIKTAHHLLDDVAKNKTGRDSLALAIIQGSGLNALWSAPWDVVLGKHQGTTDLCDIVELFGVDEDMQTSFNASFLYKLRESFIRLSEGYEVKPGFFMEYETDIEDIFFDIAYSEFRRRMSKDESKKTPQDISKQAVKDLMSISKEWTRSRNTSGDPIISHKAGSFGFDGWRIARFLKQVKESKVEDHG